MHMIIAENNLFQLFVGKMPYLLLLPSDGMPF
jgi:hypothetical protein